MNTALFGIAWKGTAVLAAAWMMALMLRRRSAATRHLIWTACAAALLALPVFTVEIPAWRVPAGKLLALTPNITFHVSSAAPIEAAGGVSRPLAVQGGGSRAVTVPVPAAKAMLWVWTGGAALLLFQLLFGYVRMWRMRRVSPLSEMAEPCDAIAGELGILQTVEVRELPGGSMPMTFGMWRPVLFLPATAVEWSRVRLRAVVIHELAHVLRGDAAARMIGRVALALFWWNPLAWNAWRELLKESERAADDLVLKNGEGATDYASHLLEIARGTVNESASLCAAVAMARRQQLEGRLLAILNSKIDRHAPGRGWTLAAVAMAIAVAAPFAAVRAQEAKQAAPQTNGQATFRAVEAQKNPEVFDQTTKQLEAEERKLLEAALRLQAEKEGQQSAASQSGLLKLGDLAARRNQHADAVDFYSRAVAIGDTPGIANALIYLALRKAAQKEDTLQAKQMLQHAIDVDPTGPNAGRAMTWMGHLDATQGLAGLAESSYQRAISMNRPGTVEAAFGLEMYAKLLTEQSRVAEAEPLLAQAATIRKARVAEISQRRTAQAVSNPPGVRVGNGVTQPVLLSKLEPEYTNDARIDKVVGTVVLQITVETDGTADNIALMKSVGFGLDEKAVEAVQQWRFKPGTRDGLPVAVIANVEVNFKLF